VFFSHNTPVNGKWVAPYTPESDQRVLWFQIGEEARTSLSGQWVNLSTPESSQWVIPSTPVSDL
jgi:hypothetical protein